jgi:hypothetical protein
MVLAQLRGFVSNLWASAMRAKWEGFLPPSIVSTIKFVGNMVPDAFGFGTPFEQLQASVVLGTVAVLSSIITLGATLALVVVFGATFAVGIIRHIPAVEGRWPLPEYEVFD